MKSTDTHIRTVIVKTPSFFMRRLPVNRIGYELKTINPSQPCCEELVVALIQASYTYIFPLSATNCRFETIPVPRYRYPTFSIKHNHEHL
jgi:hypothetical protein